MTLTGIVEGALSPSEMTKACSNPRRPEEERRLGTKIVAAVQKEFRRFPLELRETELAHPRVVLASWKVADRTRNVLDRLLPQIARQETWTVERYLQLPQFGAYCLVDLLAAREERLDPRSRTPASVSPWASIDELSAAIVHGLPTSTENLGQRLFAEGLCPRPMSVAALMSVYAKADRLPPFRVLSTQGMKVAVPVGSVELSARIIATARHCITDWGLTSIETVTGRLQATEPSLVSADMVRTLLMALPHFRWLDEATGWFSFSGERSRLRVAIRKVFAAADRILFHELRQALAKGRSYLLEAPTRALERYLSDLMDCEIGGETAWVRPRHRPAALLES